MALAGFGVLIVQPEISPSQIVDEDKEDVGALVCGPPSGHKHHHSEEGRKTSEKEAGLMRRAIHGEVVVQATLREASVCSKPLSRRGPLPTKLTVLAIADSTSPPFHPFNPALRPRHSCEGLAMRQSIACVAVVVEDYDDAIDFYVNTLGFTLVEDSAVPEQKKRWVVVAPDGSSGTQILLARASNAEQTSRIGDQTGGRVFLFLHTDDVWRDVEVYKGRGVEFVREPTEADFGTAAVFKDLYGNLWDLVQPRESG